MTSPQRRTLGVGEMSRGYDSAVLMCFYLAMKNQ